MTDLFNYFGEAVSIGGIVLLFTRGKKIFDRVNENSMRSIERESNAKFSAIQTEWDRIDEARRIARARHPGESRRAPSP